MLLGNYNQWNANPGRAIGGPTDPTRYLGKAGTTMLFYHINEGFTVEQSGATSVIQEGRRTSFNNGYVPPYSWVLAPVAGGMSAHFTSQGQADTSASLTKGVGCSATVAGAATVVDAALSLLSQLAATVAGAATVSTASLVGTVTAAGTSAGTSSTAASMGLKAGLSANSDGVALATASLRGTASMSVSIYVNTGTATAEEVAAAVWNALASVYNNPDTMGELLNGAGGGSSPSQVADAVWDELLSSHVTSGSAAQILKAIKALASAGL